MSKISLQAKYFWIAIVVIGSIGIWLPVLVGIEIKLKEISILLTTYYVSLYFSGCLDSVLNKIGRLVNTPSEVTTLELLHRFMDVIALILLSIALVVCTIFFTKNGYFIVAIILSIVGTIISLYMWWQNNNESDRFETIMRGGGYGTNW